MDYHKLAGGIVDRVGGKENINSLIHCMTRLRFKLKNNSLAKTEEIKALDGVLTVVLSGGQYQVVIGNRVNDVFDQVVNIIGEEYSGEVEEKPEENEKEKKNLFSCFIDVIVGIISPIIGILAAAGILKGILAMCTALHWLKATDGTYVLLYALSDSLYYFLPILLGFSAGKKFKGNPFISAVIGGGLVYPTIVTAFSAGKALTFFGIPIIMANYTSSIFPVILAAWLAAKIERWLNKNLLPQLRLIFTPLITLFVTGSLTFLVVGPILTEFSKQLANAVMGLYGLSPVIAGIILGAFWQVIVIFGLHYAFIPVLINNIATLHYDPVNAILSVTVFAQAGAALGVLLKTRSKKVRSVAGAATISAMLGITEPAIYGVSLPYRKPFVMAGIAGGLGGAITAFMHAKMFGFGANAIFAAPLFINPKGIDSSLYAYFISSAVALFGTAILTYLFGFNDTANKKQEEKISANLLDESSVNKKVIDGSAADNEIKNVYNPLSGQIIPINEIKDEVFSSGSVGSGFAIIPEDDKVYAPFDGTVMTVFKTKHAIGLISHDGLELLIHLGIDTVELNGQPYEVKIKEGDTLKKGQLLAEVNWKFIKDKNYDCTTPIIVTNSAEFRSIELNANKNGMVKNGELVLTIS